MSTMQELVELGEILTDVQERREKWEEQKALLKLSEEAERTLSELLDKVDELTGHMREITAGVSRANRARAGNLQDDEHAMEQKLREALVELERSKALADQDWTEKKERRKSESEMFRELRKDIRKALGPNAKEAAENARQTVAEEFPAEEDEVVAEGFERSDISAPELEDESDDAERS